MNKTEYPLMTTVLVEKLVNFLNSKENKCSILEHGTGNSTLFWCKQKNVDTIVSIESSLEWGKQVEQWLSELSQQNSLQSNPFR
jgi:hypothetical protein